MLKEFKVGDHVRWNSEAGIVSGTITSKVTADTLFKGYTHHASESEPQYLIKSDKTDHVTIHKGSDLTLISEQRGGKQKHRVPKRANKSKA